MEMWVTLGRTTQIREAGPKSGSTRPPKHVRRVEWPQERALLSDARSFAFGFNQREGLRRASPALPAARSSAELAEQPLVARRNKRKESSDDLHPWE